MVIGIYKITNKTNNKTYIGKSNTLEKRLYKHKFDLSKGNHVNKHLQNAWNKYGGEQFEFKIIFKCNKEDNLDEKEKFFIKKYKSNVQEYGYNKTTGGEGGSLNDEIKKKISATSRGKNTTLSYSDIAHIKMAMWCLMDRKEISRLFNVNLKVLTQIATGKSFGYILEELNNDIHNLKGKLIKERNNQIVEMFDTGKTITQISNDTEISTSIVEKCVYKYTNTVNTNKKKYQDIYNKVMKLKQQGMKNYRIAKQLKISPSTVSRYLDGTSNPLKELSFKKITKEMENQITDLYFNQNKTSKEIAKQFNVSPNTIMTYVNKVKMLIPS